MNQTNNKVFHFYWPTIIWGLSLLLFFQPILIIKNVAYPFESPKFFLQTFLSGLLLLIYSLKFFNRQNKAAVAFGSLDLFVLFLFLSKIVSLVFSLNKEASLVGLAVFQSDSLLHLLSLLGIYFLVSQVAKPAKNQTQLLVYLFAGAVLTAFTGLFFYYHNFAQNSNWYYRIRSSIGEPNRLAFTLEIAMAAGWLLLVKIRKRFLKIAVSAGLLVIFLAWLITFSRSAQLSLLISLAVLVAAILLLKVNFYQNIVKNKILLIVFLLIFLLASPLLYKQWQSTFFPPIAWEKTSLSLRLQEWQTIVKLVGQRNIFRQLVGFGPEAVSSAANFSTSPFYLNDLSLPINIKIRNYYLHSLANDGLIFLLAWLILLIAAIKSVFNQVKNKQSNTRFFILLLPITLILVHSFFYYLPLTVSLYFWFFLGLISTRQAPRFYIKQSLVNKIAFFSGIVILYFGLGVFSLQIDSKLPKSLYLSPYSASLWQNLSSKKLANAQFSIDQKQKPKAEKSFAKAVVYLQISKFFQSTNPKTYISFANLLYWGGVYIDKKYHYQALEYVTKYLENNHQDYLAYDKLGLIYLDLGQLDKAKKEFLKALEIKPTYAGGYLHTGEVLKQQGKTNEAIASYQKALEIHPNWDLALKEIDKASKLKDKK